MRQLVMVAALCMAIPGTGTAQADDLDRAAERARQAWFSHNAAALVAQSPRLLIQLPGAEPSVALGPGGGLRAGLRRASAQVPGGGNPGYPGSGSVTGLPLGAEGVDSGGVSRGGLAGFVDVPARLASTIARFYIALLALNLARRVE